MRRLLVGGMVVAGLFAWARRVDETGPVRPPVRPDAGASPFAGAIAERRAMHGLEGREREAQRRRAVRAYRDARQVHTDAGVVAESAFRVGELLRAGGEIEAALAEFALAAEAGLGTSLGARARLELAHVHRREGRSEDAIAGYERVLFDPSASPRTRDVASFWRGRVLAELGNLSSATREWERVATSGVDPLLRIHAVDWMARIQLALGDRDAALRVVDRCRALLEPRIVEASELGRKLTRAWNAMVSRTTRGVPAAPRPRLRR